MYKHILTTVRPYNCDPGDWDDVPPGGYDDEPEPTGPGEYGPEPL